MWVSFSAVMFGCVHNTPMSACIGTCTWGFYVMYMYSYSSFSASRIFVLVFERELFCLAAIQRMSNEVIPPELTKVPLWTHMPNAISLFVCVHMYMCLYVIQRCSCLTFYAHQPKMIFLFQMTQQEINFVAQFLSENFTEVCSQFDVVVEIDLTLVHNIYIRF